MEEEGRADVSQSAPERGLAAETGAESPLLLQECKQFILPYKIDSELRLPHAHLRSAKYL